MRENAIQFLAKEVQPNYTAVTIRNFLGDNENDNNNHGEYTPLTWTPLVIANKETMFFIVSY